MRNLTEQSATLENIAHIDRNINIRTMKAYLTPRIQNSRKIQDIIVQTIAHVTTYKNNETNSRYRNVTYLENNKKNSYHQYKKF